MSSPALPSNPSASDATARPPKRRWLWALVGILVALPALFVLAIVCAIAFYSSAEEFLARHVSPQGRFTLVLRQAGPSLSARAPSTVSLYATAAAKTGEKKLATFSINNDGANLSSDSCQVTWLTEVDGIAQVTCHGQEQTDDIWLVNLRDGEAWQLAGE